MSNNSVYEVVCDESTEDRLVIRDVGDHRQVLTITNDAERVVDELRSMGALPPGRRLFYYDSQGELDEIVVNDHGFVCFGPGGEW
jgi:hypothetical protein